MNFSSASFSFRKFGAFAALLFAGAAAVPAEPLRYAGSDFLAGAPEKAFAAGLEKIAGEKPEAELRGSIAGEAALRAGKADFAALMLPGNGENVPEIRDGTWKAVPLAYQVAYVVVAAANPANEITFDQLASVFGNFAQKTAEKWEDLGVEGFSSALQPCVGDSSRTNVVSYFQRKALPRYALRASVRELVSDDAVYKEIVNNLGTIAVVGSAVPAGIPVKALAVADTRDDANATPYSPSFANVYNRDYPLAVPLCIVYPAKNRLQLKAALSFLYSQEMADALAGAGFLPLERRVREQFQKGIDNIK